MTGAQSTRPKPLRVLSLGAGVQSTTVLLMAIHGDIPPVDHVIFADTGWEPRSVYRHLQSLKSIMAEHAIPFDIVSAGNIRDDALDPTHRFASMPLHITRQDGEPAMARRQCTSEYKLKPLVQK